MKKFISLQIIVLFFVNSYSQFKVRVNLASIPVSSDKIFIAGSFNNWKPDDETAELHKNADSIFFIDFPDVDAGLYEFKFTRGSWEKVECKKDGSDIENRSVKIQSDTVLNFSIEAWKDQFAVQEKKHTASKNVIILDSAFFIPQLNRYRRIWAYIPADYESTSKRFPVLYMHDGQNLFDEFTAPFGEWSVDEILDTISNTKECIVIGIDNGAEKRMGEYNPYDFTMHDNNGDKLIKTEGDAYVDFLAKTLKPYIDKKFRTLPDARQTCVAGSSMGGLISLYAILKYPNVFGNAGVFSPAFWTAPKLADDVKKLSSKINGNIYFYAGGAESETMVSDMQNVIALLKSNQKIKLKVQIVPDGKHNEANWRREFPGFYKWIF
ncbi:MAG TPA: alpha/beta hydrolase-fold protein [Puia sp.]|nr:alpha/beta hydrolase-fold protein [Puia sp.]